MKFYPTRPHRQFFCFVITSILLILSCSKDSDLLNEAIFNEAAQSVEEREAKEESEDEISTETIAVVEESTEEVQNEEQPEENEIELESRTTSFPTLQDAHFQSGTGYNQHIIRLQEDHRTSYLMFDISQIDTIGGSITQAKLEFTIDTDGGDGTINVYLGESSNWEEHSLSEVTAPKIDVLLGSLVNEYKIGDTEEIELDTENLNPEIATLVLDHEEGDDLAIASKEHSVKKGPHLIVTYDAPIDADEVVVPDSEETTESQEEVENEAPKAVPLATPESGNAPLEVQFKGSSSTDDNAVQKYKWDFKDGTSSNSKNPSHTFADVGEYEVELTVEDEEGLEHSETITITVTENENEAPKAVVSATPESGNAPLEVQFKGSSSSDDKEVKKYKWDFKDGTTATSKNPSHTFAEAGEYEVVLTVEDEEGLDDSTTITIDVSAPIQNDPPRAVVSATPESGTAPLEVQFKGSSSTDDKEVTKYRWVFNNGTTSSSKNPSRTFTEAGEYEVILTVEDEEGLEDSATIIITVEEAEPPTPTPNADVRYWQNLFDSRWSQTKSDAVSLSRSKNRNQEYYNLGLYIDGLRNIWQATGDNSYLDEALSLINTTVDDAQSVGGGFLGWRASDGSTYPLWDSFYWRQVVTILRIIEQSPSLRTSSKYRNQHEELVEFSERHIWDRYDNEGQTHNFYRTKTHMTAHWARIALELYLITGKSKYRQVFNNISYGSMIGRPSNLRNQIFPNPRDNEAYAWDDEWGVSYGSEIQDTSHGGAIVGMIVLAHDQGLYWKRSDINALLKTVDVVWTAPDVIKENVDASGGNASRGRLHEWFYLARYSQSLQNRIKRDYLTNPHLNYYGCQALGVAALNAQILADGRAIYPTD